MNNVFKVVFNKSTGVFSAVCEYAKGQGKSSSKISMSGVSRPQFRIAKLSASLFVAIGFLSLTNVAHAIIGIDKGYDNYSNGNGSQIVVLGNAKTRFGNELGAQSINIGNDVKALGDSSIAIGGDDTVVASKHNMTYMEYDKDGNPTGMVTKSLKQLFEDTTGVTGVIAAKWPQTKTGHGAVAIGVSTQAMGGLSTAFGVGSKVQENAHLGLALGAGAVVTKRNAVAIGAGATTDVKAKKYEEAIVQVLDDDGNPTGEELHYKGFQGGADDLQPGDYISFGKKGYERQLKNVAAGRVSPDSTDAINGSQLVSLGQAMTKKINDKVDNIETYFHVNEKNGNQAAGNATTNLGGIRDKAGATGNYAVTAGVNAKAVGNNAVAVGYQSQATGASSFALGENATAVKDNSIAIGADTKANTQYATAIGREATATGQGAFAFGGGAKGKAANAKGTGSIAIGGYGDNTNVGAKTSANYALALGSGSVASQANGVALGAASKADRAALADGNSAYVMTGADKAGVVATVKGDLAAVSVGTVDKTRQIVNVAAGSEDSDAVNVAQLKTVAKEAEKGLDFSGDTSSAADNKFNRKLGQETKIIGGVTDKDKLTDNNIGVVSNGTDTLTVKLAKDVKVDSVTTGDTKISDNGLTITGGPSVTKTGINAGNKKITNVAKGVANTDAVNVKQLNDTRDEVSQGFTEVISRINKLGNNEIRLGAVNDNTETTAQKLNKTGGLKFNIKGDNGLEATAETDTITVKIDDATKKKIDNAADKNLSNITDAGKKAITKLGNVVEDGKHTTVRTETDANGKKTFKVDVDTSGTVTDGDNKIVTGDTVFDAIQANQTKMADGENTTIEGDGSTANPFKVNVKTLDSLDNNSKAPVNSKAVNTAITEVKNSPITFKGDNGSETTKLGDTFNIKSGDAAAGFVGTNLQTKVENDKVVIGMTDKPTFTTVTADKVTINNAPTAGTDAINKDYFDANKSRETVSVGDALQVTPTGGKDNKDFKIELKQSTKDDIADGKKHNTVVAGDNVTVTDTQNTEGGKAFKVSVKTLDSLDNNSKAPVSSKAVNTAITNAKDEIKAMPITFKADTNAGSGIDKGSDQVLGSKIEFVTGEAKGGFSGDNLHTKVEDGGKVTIGLKDAPTFKGKVVAKGLDAGGEKITGVAPGTDGTDAVNKDQLDNVSTNVTNNANEIAKGLNIAADNGDDDNVKLGETVKYTSKDGTITTTVTDNEIDFKITTTDITADSTTGKVTEPTTADANKIATAGDVANAINNSFWKTKAKTGVDGGVVKNSADRKIKAGEEVNFDAGKNMELTQTADGYVYATKAKVEFDNVKVGDVVLNKDKGINAGNKQIKGVKAGTEPTDAVNVSQLNMQAAAAKTEVKSNGNTAVKESRATDGHTIYEVSAEDTTVSVGEGLTVTPTLTESTDADAGVDDYKIEFNQATKDSLKKADSALQNIKTTVNGQPLKTLSQDDNTQNFVQGKNIVLENKNGSLEVKTADEVEFNKVEVGDVVIDDKGINAGDKVISNVAAGVKGTDAVNLNQLNATNNTIAKGINFGGSIGAANNYALGDTIKVLGDNNITSETVDGGVQLALADVVNIGTKNPVSINGNEGEVTGLTNTTLTLPDFATKGRAATEEQLKEAKDQLTAAAVAATTKVEAGKNMVVTPTSNTDGSTTYTVAMAEELDVTSVTAGDTVMNNDGITINNGNAKKPVSLSKDGLDNGGNKIVNVAAGTKDTDAVNVSQLKATTAAAKTEVEAGTNIVSVDERIGDDNQTIYTVNAKGTSASAGSDYVTVTSRDAGNNVTDYAVDVAENVKTATDTVLNKGLTFTADNGETDTAKLGSKVAVIGDDNITTKASGNQVNVSLNKDITVDSVSVGDVHINSNGIDAGNMQVKNVKAGTAPTDAVNVSQLKALNTSVNNAFDQVQGHIDKVDTDLKAGIAGATALSFLQRPNEPGESVVSVGMGGYKDQAAVSLGLAGNSDNNKWLYKMGASFNTQKDVNYGGSIGYQFR
ncbi:MAG: hypothetical protein CSA42_05845 [Gammaproteobacteria bacterium]|nr:MAG: hypothetical protein CSA42_05845 [Gammaproteobacteria bacterium]